MRRAFTLIEVLIASSIAALIALVVAFSFGSALRAFTAQERAIDRVESARVSFIRIIYDVRRSSGILPDSNCSRLSLSLDGRTVSFDLANGKVRRRVDGSSSYLTEEGRISDLQFFYPLPNLAGIQLMTADGRVFTSEAYVRNI